MSKNRAKFYINIVMNIAGAVLFGAGFFLQDFLPAILYYPMVFIGGVALIIGMDKTDWRRIRRDKYRTFGHYITNRTRLFKTLAFISVFLYVIIPFLRPITLVPCIAFPICNMILLCRHPKYLSFLNSNTVLPNAISSSLLCNAFIILIEASNVKISILFAIELIVLSIIGVLLYYRKIAKIKEKKKYSTNLAAVFLFLMVLISGAILGINRHYDFIPSTSYTVMLQDKSNNTLYFGQFHELNTNLSIKVSSKQYESVRPKDALPIVIHKGLLGMSWYEVDWDVIEQSE